MQVDQPKHNAITQSISIHKVFNSIISNTLTVVCIKYNGQKTSSTQTVFNII